MPHKILSSVLLPQPLRPMMPRVSPRSTEKLIPSSTCSRSNLRGRSAPSTCSRTVSRRTDGIWNALRHAVDFEDGRHQRYSAARGARRRKIAAPTTRTTATTPARYACAVGVGHAPRTSTARENSMIGVGGQM